MIEYIKENWVDLCLVAWGVASIVALLTPSDKDNTWLQKIGMVADAFGLKLKGAGSVTDIAIRTIKRVVGLVKKGK